MTDVFERVLRGKIAKQIGDETGFLSIGYAKDYAEYRGRCGKIEGLNVALSLCDEAHDEIMGKGIKDSNTK